MHRNGMIFYHEIAYFHFFLFHGYYIFLFCLLNCCFIRLTRPFIFLFSSTDCAAKLPLFLLFCFFGNTSLHLRLCNICFIHQDSDG